MTQNQLVLQLTVVVTGCLAFLILIVGFLLIIAKGASSEGEFAISADGVQASGVIGGIAFLGYLAYLLIKTVMSPKQAQLLPQGSPGETPEGAGDADR